MLVSAPSTREAATGERSSPVGGDGRAGRGSAQSEGMRGPQGPPSRRDPGGHIRRPPPQHTEGGTHCSLPMGCSQGVMGPGSASPGRDGEGERCGMLVVPRLCCDLELGNEQAGLGLPLGLGLRLLHPAAVGSGRVRRWEEVAAEAGTGVPAPAERLLPAPGSCLSSTAACSYPGPSG